MRKFAYEDNFLVLSTLTAKPVGRLIQQTKITILLPNLIIGKLSDFYSYYYLYCACVTDSQSLF